jgi:hypothetical protein
MRQSVDVDVGPIRRQFLARKSDFLTLHSQKADDHRPAGTLRVRGRLARNRTVPSLVRIPRVEHDFFSERRRKNAREIGNSFQRNSEHDDVPKCCGILRRSGGRACSETFNHRLEFVRVSGRDPYVLLGHTAEGLQADGEITPRNLRECEAEAVALLCCAALELPGVDHCRGYIQAWWGSGNPIPERSAQRVLKVADQILKAGTTQTEALS